MHGKAFNHSDAEIFGLTDWRYWIILNVRNENEDGGSMGKDDLLKILQTLLKTDAPFNFLLELKNEDLEKLVVAVRDRVEGCNKD